ILFKVLLFAVMFGTGLTKIREKAFAPMTDVLQSFLKGPFAVTKMIMYLAPIGAMGAMGFTIGNYGIEALSSLGLLMLSFYGTCIVFIVGVIGSVLYFYVNVNIFKLLKYIKEELLIVLGTRSEEHTSE